MKGVVESLLAAQAAWRRALPPLGRPHREGRSEVLCVGTAPTLPCTTQYATSLPTVSLHFCFRFHSHFESSHSSTSS